MNDLEFRIRVQGMVKQWVNQTRIANNISAAVMEDALNKVLVDLKDEVMKEFIVSVTPQVPVDDTNNEEKE